MVAESFRVERGGRSIPVEWYPAAPGSPAVLVLHEIYGLNDDMRRIARRFQASGYHAAVPDLADGRPWVCLAGALLDLGRGKGPAVGILEEALSVIRSRPGVGKVGAAGFCMGGGFALLLGEKLDAAGVYYGPPPRARALTGMCPVVGGYGAKDRIFAPRGRWLKSQLEGLGKEVDLEIYEDCGHSYMGDSGHPVLAALGRPLIHVEYNEAAAEDSWRRMLSFFGRHLGDAAGGAEAG